MSTYDAWKAAPCERYEEECSRLGDFLGDNWNQLILAAWRAWWRENDESPTKKDLDRIAEEIGREWWEGGGPDFDLEAWSRMSA